MAAKFSRDTKRVCLLFVIVSLLIHSTECNPSTCKLAQTCGQCIENPGKDNFDLFPNKYGVMVTMVSIHAVDLDLIRNLRIMLFLTTINYNYKAFCNSYNFLFLYL